MKLLALVLSSFLTLHSSFSAPPNVIFIGDNGTGEEFLSEGK